MVDRHGRQQKPLRVPLHRCQAPHQGAPALRHGTRSLRCRYRLGRRQACRHRRLALCEREDSVDQRRSGASAAGRTSCIDRRGILRRHRFAGDWRRYAQGDALCLGERRRALLRRMGRCGGRGYARDRRRCGRADRSRIRTNAAGGRSRSCRATGQPAGASGARQQRAVSPPLRLGRGR